MKKQILAYLSLPILVTSYAQAGINGSYKVRGSEAHGGQKFSFTGTVSVTNYKSGKYALNFNDGDRVTYRFNFSKPLKETATTQMVTAKNNIGTSTATFYSKSGKMLVNFNYQSLDGSVKG